MTSSLRLYLVDGWPARQRSCEWALFEAGSIVRRGCSTPDGWPKSDITEAMLDPALLGCYLVKLPGKARGRDFELNAYAYALEDQLLEDPAHYHFALGGETNAGTRIVAIGRSRLMTLMAELASLGRSPRRLVAAAELLPQSEDDWLLWKNPAGTLLLQAGRQGNCPLASVAEIRNLAAGATPPPACLRVIAGIDPLVVAGSDLPVVDGGFFDWASADWNSATQLLVGTFRPRQDLARWRRAMLWSMTAFALGTAGFAGEWALLAWRQAALKHDIQELLRNAQPGQSTVVPLVQLIATADRKQHQQGKSGVSDFLVLVAQAADLAEGRSVQEINYQTGRLIMQLDALDVSREKSLRETLAIGGLDMRVARQANVVRIAISIDSDGEQP